jgi:Domain of unknown function (DUF4190)
MKICPICNQTYTDANLNFCLNDGGVLQLQAEDSPPTVIINPTKQTNPDWQGYQPPTYQNQQLTQNQNWGMQGVNQFANRGKDQTLPTVSLILAVLGVVLFCCYGGIPFGLIALILGYLGLQNANKNPERYGGREMAIAGMVIGGLIFVITILLFFLGILSDIIF